MCLNVQGLCATASQATCATEDHFKRLAKTAIFSRVNVHMPTFVRCLGASVMRTNSDEEFRNDGYNCVYRVPLGLYDAFAV